MTYKTEEEKMRHREQQLRYLLKHPNTHKESMKRYRQKYPEKTHAATKAWVMRNREWVNKRKSDWMKNTEKGRLTRRNQRYRTRHQQRILFTLNRKFAGAILHHVDDHIGVWIPDSLHRSVHHNLLSGRGMIRINDAVSEWLSNPRDKQR